MKKNQPTPQYQLSPSGQLAIVLSNTRYTYAHFTEFHVTVLNILGNSDISHLPYSQKKNTLHFINLILDLLDAPRRPAPKTAKVQGYQKLTPRPEFISKRASTPVMGNMVLNDDPVSPEDLEKLLGWINRVVALKRITVERLLDEFYSLGIGELKLS